MSLRLGTNQLGLGWNIHRTAGLVNLDPCISLLPIRVMRV